MIPHLLLTLAGIVLLLTTLPLALELLTLSLAATLPPRRVATTSAPDLRLAVIVPAHNEEQLIGACVASLLATRTPATTVYVVAHNCTDSTAERARAAGAEVLILNEGLRGKGTALDHGFTIALARGAEALLVIDADSVVSPGLPQAVAAALAAGSHAVQCRYLVANADATPRTRLMSLALLGMNLVRPRGRSRLGLSCGIFGNGFALTAETLRRVPYVANSLVEDVEYHLLLVRAGLRVDFLDAAQVLGEMPQNKAAAATQRARWEGGRILMRRRFSAPLLLAVLSGRLALLEPLLDLRSLPLATQAILLLIALALPLTWLRAYASAGLLTLVLYVLVSAALGPEPGATLRALLSVPGYLLHKIALIPRTRMAARRNATWVRTERNLQPETETVTAKPPAV